MKNKIKRKLKNAAHKATQKVASQRLLRPNAVGVYVPLAGTSIDVAAAEAIAKAKKQRCPVHFNFNGVKLVATPKKSVTTIVWEFHQIINQQADKYHHSKAANKRQATIKEGQQQIDAAFMALPAILAEAEPDRLAGTVRWLRDNQSAMDDCAIEYRQT